MNAYRKGPTHAAPSAERESAPVEKRILVVDDDLHSREGLRASLIAIIDLDLPPVHGVTVSGWDLARIFRAYHPAISIIVVSAEDRDAVRAEAEQLRVSEFLEKPINPAQLKMIVRTLEVLSEGHSTGEFN